MDLFFVVYFFFIKFKAIRTHNHGVILLESWALNIVRKTRFFPLSYVSSVKDGSVLEPTVGILLLISFCPVILKTFLLVETKTSEKKTTLLQIRSQSYQTFIFPFFQFLLLSLAIS